MWLKKILTSSHRHNNSTATYEIMLLKKTGEPAEELPHNKQERATLRWVRDTETRSCQKPHPGIETHNWEGFHNTELLPNE